MQQTTGLTRTVLDKYYTKPEIAEWCISHIKTHISIQSTDIIIEPSAGNGAFIEYIKPLSNESIFYDLEPENEEIVKQDYLELPCNNLLNKNVHIIGNPPFGRQSSLAIKFIKHSSGFCSSISFILPKSFKKDSLKKSFPLKFHLLFECDIPDNSFLVEGVEHDVPCVFQIWQRKPHDRPVADVLSPTYFEFVSKEQPHEISFRRVGVNAGVIDTNTEEKSKQSHYFIKFTNSLTINENLYALTSVSFEFNNTVGPKSISKQELIAKFNSVLSE
jgi:hypothetical protein